MIVKKPADYVPALGDIRWGRKHRVAAMYSGNGVWKSLNPPSADRWQNGTGPSSRLRVYETTDYSFWRRK